MKDSQQVAARVKITGRVQGVGFRYFVYRNAKKNEVNGWVRNREDGSVEARFEGPESLVDSMISLCRQGPLGSSVKDVEVEKESTEGRYEDFQLKHE